MLYSRRRKPKSLKRVGYIYYRIRMKNLTKIVDLEELNPKEKGEINGGETFWYYSLYFLAEGITFAKGALENPPDLPSATVYK